MQWSDEESRDDEQEKLLLARQEAFARAVAPYQLREIHSLRGTNGWLKMQLAKEAKTKAATAS